MKVEMFFRGPAGAARRGMQKRNPDGFEVQIVLLKIIATTE
jgi:hypothetical protein